MNQPLRCTLLAALLMGNAVRGADSFYTGTWKIDSAVVAPWWTEKQKPDMAESKTLIGKTFAIRGRDITGPRQVACKDPHFEVTQAPAEMLFQGMLEKVPDRTKALASLGFKGKQWKTLITGCENEVEFHFLDDRTAAFGLNNLIYIVRQQ